MQWWLNLSINLVRLTGARKQVNHCFQVCVSNKLSEGNPLQIRSSIIYLDKDPNGMERKRGTFFLSPVLPSRMNRFSAVAGLGHRISGTLSSRCQKSGYQHMSIYWWVLGSLVWAKVEGLYHKLSLFLGFPLCYPKMTTFQPLWCCQPI